MDLGSLAIFRTVAKEHSVTRAAELLGRVPSNVTTRIQQLEAEIGVPLFQRDKKGMALTSQGQAYLDYVDRILNLADEAKQVVNPTSPTGVLRIGSMECTVASRLPVPLAGYNSKWPEVTIDLSTAPTRQLIDSLLAHRIDCALIAVPPGEWWLGASEIEKVAIFREELVLLLPPGHAQVHCPDDIETKSLAAFAPGCTYRMLAEEWLTGYGTRPARFAIQDVRSYHAMFACTTAGSCISIMPRTVLDLMPRNASLVEKPLMTVDTYLACRPGFATPAFVEFCDTLAQFSDIRDEANAAV